MPDPPYENPPPVEKKLKRGEVDFNQNAQNTSRIAINEEFRGSKSSVASSSNSQYVSLSRRSSSMVSISSSSSFESVTSSSPSANNNRAVLDENLKHASHSIKSKKNPDFFPKAAERDAQKGIKTPENASLSKLSEATLTSKTEITLKLPDIFSSLNQVPQDSSNNFGEFVEFI